MVGAPHWDMVKVPVFVLCFLVFTAIHVPDSVEQSAENVPEAEP
jgi:hypothetical protein